MKGKRVMNTVTKVAAASVVAVCAQSLCAAEITWGGSSGRWHAKSNWIGGEKPAAGDSVIFPAGGSYAVEIDTKTPELSYVKVLPGLPEDVVTFTDEDPTDETRRSIFVVGDGYRFTVGENRKVRVYGNSVQLGVNGSNKTYLDVGPNAEFSMDAGRIYVRNGGILVNTNATLKINGGTLDYNFDSDYLKLAKNATVIFNGGSNIVGRIANKISENDGEMVSEFDGEGSKIIFAGGYTEFPEQYAFDSYVDPAKTTIEFLGGTLNLKRRIIRSQRTLLPAKGGKLINRYPGLVLTDENGENDVWELGGEAFFTAEHSYLNLGWGQNTRIQGGGELNAWSLHQGIGEVYADLHRINIASNFQSSSVNGRLYFQDGITFGAYGAVGVDPKKSARFVPSGKVTFDTVDAVDGTTLRSFDLPSRFDFSQATAFEVEGEGTVDVNPEVAFKYLHNFRVDAGSTVTLTNAKAKIIASAFELGAGSTLLVGTNLIDVAGVAQVGEGAKIRYSFDSLQSGTMYPLWFGPQGCEPPVSHFEFVPALPEGWTVATSGSTAYLWDGTIVDVTVDNTTGSRGKWLGKNGGNWNDSDNWSPYVGKNYNIPGGQTDMMAVFGGNRQLAVTNDLPSNISWLRNLYTMSGAGPYVISDNAISVMYQTVAGDSSSSVANNASCRFPFVIESAMSKYRKNENDGQSYFRVQANGKAPVVLSGGGMFPRDVLNYRGDLRLGGKWLTLGLYPVSGGGRDTRLVLNPGAYLETTEQGSNQTVTASYQISAGAGMTINGSVWRWATTENTHFVDGVVTSMCPVQATARQTFIGDGVLSLAMVQSDAEGVGDLKFAEDITVRPAGWKTVRAGADNPMTMVARGNATIGAWGDWTYGAEEGFESSSTPADRALKVVGGAKTYVSFDTEGNTITLNDPLVVEKWSTLRKKGEGALVLKSDENDLADSEIELIGGELRLSEPQAFGKLTFAGGKIAIDDGFNADTYTPIFTAKKIIGEVEVAGRFGVKTVAGDNGITVSVRRKRGAAVILR